MDELSDALALEARQKIYNVLKDSPGLHFREIQRRTGFATGLLQYHLDYLIKKHLIRQIKEKKFTRFYLIREEQVDEKEMAALRQEGQRKIIMLLLNKKRATNKQIAKAILISPSTASFHLSKLLENGLITRVRKGKKTYFYLVEPEKHANLLVSYKKSFFDEMVDNFVEVWQQI